MQLTLLPRITLIFGLFFGLNTEAKKYYKHVDEDGIIHYSDQPPAADVAYESWQVRPEDTQYEVKIINRGPEKAPAYYGVNPYHGPVAVRMEFTLQENAVADPPLPATFVIPGNSDELLTTVTGQDQYQAWSFQFSYTSVMGDPNAKHQDGHVYQRPFQADQQHFISQAFFGEFTHQGEQNRHAIDIVMPEGTPVLAARGGVVMDIADDFYDGGTDASQIQRGNYIRILHDDGSMGVYAHLQLESVRVAPGQRIDTGHQIALSGNTGFTSGPHLHFAVQVNDNLRLVSVPFLLQHRNGEVKFPTVGPL
ncbi:peptidoglycan DD-metalloendopeptidase family protein [Marinicella meishanensis]|uniref:peptidoglycan DD-metalloendopeptidase family protein n=1 Tax=Marinicella meishanensis TaxID=2873263 RepID=UPI001CBD68D5|nr:M23 family metallopeptidase [Marinicella sp. NBU2979]